MDEREKTEAQLALKSLMDEVKELLTARETAGDPKDYRVGHGKPPMETRFKPGRSGNPKGRPKGSKNYKSILTKLLDERVKTEPRGRRVSHTEVMVRNNGTEPGRSRA